MLFYFKRRMNYSLIVAVKSYAFLMVFAAFFEIQILLFDGFFPLWRLEEQVATMRQNFLLFFLIYDFLERFDTFCLIFGFNVQLDSLTIELRVYTIFIFLEIFDILLGLLRNFWFHFWPLHFLKVLLSLTKNLKVFN